MHLLVPGVIVIPVALVLVVIGFHWFRSPTRGQARTATRQAFTAWHQAHYVRPKLRGSANWEVAEARRRVGDRAQEVTVEQERVDEAQRLLWDALDQLKKARERADEDE